MDRPAFRRGFSCRTQIHQFDSGGNEGVHLAQLLAGLATAPDRGAGGRTVVPTRSAPPEGSTA